MYLRLLLLATLLSTFAPALAIAAPGTQAARPKVSAPFILAGGTGNQQSPNLAGNVMVYTACKAANCDVWGMDLTSRQPYPISQGDWSEGQPSTDGVRVAWRDSRSTGATNPDNLLNNFDIYGTNLQEKKAFPMGRAPRMQNRPSVWGNFAVWADFRDAGHNEDQEAGNVYLYDIAGGKEQLISGARSAQSRPVTNGRVAVWTDYRNEPDANGPNADIYGYDIAKGQEFAINNAPDTQTDAAISDNVVVWADWRRGDGTSDIYGYDLTTRKEFSVSTASGSQVQPGISGNLVVWADFRNEPDKERGLNSDIYGYDLTTKQEFPIVVGPGPQSNPRVSGGTIAWEDGSNGRTDLDIVGATISGVAITAPSTPPPLLPGTGSRLFPETGRWAIGIFLEYWNKNGGLAQQGFPISEVMRETSDLDGKPYTVQYFERAVMEHHPENKPPHNVLLSQLGTFRYKQKYSNGAPSQTPNNAVGAVFFPQTGKWLGGPFLEYWQAHGGLAQQGYPISDEFQERSDLDGNTYLVQYFERAVFELHLENPPPYNVLLSQLGTFRHKQKYPDGR